MNRKLIYVIFFVILVLAWIGSIRHSNHQIQTADKAVRNTRVNLRDVVSAYHEWNSRGGQPIRSTEDLRHLFELVSNSNTERNRQWHEHDDFTDGWGNKLQILINSNQMVVVVSSGADGRWFTRDDRSRSLGPYKCIR